MSQRFCVGVPLQIVDGFVGYAKLTPEDLGFGTTLTFNRYIFWVQCEDGNDHVFQLGTSLFFDRKGI